MVKLKSVARAERKNTGWAYKVHKYPAYSRNGETKFDLPPVLKEIGTAMRDLRNDIYHELLEPVVEVEWRALLNLLRLDKPDEDERVDAALAQSESLMAARWRYDEQLAKGLFERTVKRSETGSTETIRAQQASKLEKLEQNAEKTRLARQAELEQFHFGIGLLREARQQLRALLPDLWACHSPEAGSLKDFQALVFSLSKALKGRSEVKTDFEKKLLAEIMEQVSPEAETEFLGLLSDFLAARATQVQVLNALHWIVFRNVITLEKARLIDKRYKTQLTPPCRDHVSTEMSRTYELWYGHPFKKGRPKLREGRMTNFIIPFAATMVLPVSKLPANPKMAIQVVSKKWKRSADPAERMAYDRNGQLRLATGTREELLDFHVAAYRDLIDEYPDAVIKGFFLTARYEKAFGWEYAVLIKFEHERPKPLPQNGLSAGLALGWRQVEDGIRFATLALPDGTVYECVLPHTFAVSRHRGLVFRHESWIEAYQDRRVVEKKRAELAEHAAGVRTESLRLLRLMFGAAADQGFKALHEAYQNALPVAVWEAVENLFKQEARSVNAALKRQARALAAGKEYVGKSGSGGTHAVSAYQKILEALDDGASSDLVQDSAWLAHLQAWADRHHNMHAPLRMAERRMLQQRRDLYNKLTYWLVHRFDDLIVQDVNLRAVAMQKKAKSVERVALKTEGTDWKALARSAEEIVVENSQGQRQSVGLSEVVNLLKQRYDLFRGQELTKYKLTKEQVQEAKSLEGAAQDQAHARLVLAANREAVKTRKAIALDLPADLRAIVRRLK